MPRHVAEMGVDGLLTWVINLDRAPQRWARVSARLQEIGLPAQRFSAVDARALTAGQQALLDASGFARKHGMTPLPGELGCYLSHVEVMRQLLDSQASYGLVLEDDVLLTDRVPAALAGLLAHPDRWDMVKLSAVHSGTPRRVAEVAPGQHLAVMWSRCTGSSAYLINRRAAQAYLHPATGLLPMQLPYDHVFDKGWCFGLKVRLLTPTPCIHDEEATSTIAVPAATPPRKFHWSRRLPTHAYRLGNEASRLLYAAKESWRER